MGKEAIGLSDTTESETETGESVEIETAVGGRNGGEPWRIIIEGRNIPEGNFITLEKT